MPTIGNTYPGLLDLYRQQDDAGNITPVLEILAQNNNAIMDAVVVEANQGTSHLTTVRTGLPSGTWRRLYQGVVPTKSTTAQVRDTTGVLEDWSEVDAYLVELARNPQQFRANEARAHIHGLQQQVSSTLFYGNTDIHPERFMGLAPRFNDGAAGNGKQILTGGGTGSTNTSIWFITWSENGTHLIYPEGTKGGLSREDKGKVTKEASNNGLYDVYREKFTWSVGLSVRDWRSVVRIANIDVNNLNSTGTGTSANLIDLMIDAYYRLDNPMQATGKTVIYASRTVQAFLHKQAANRANVNLTLDNFEGRPVLNFLGIPIRREDALLDTEAVVPNVVN
jgi:hypothetical protein